MMLKSIQKKCVNVTLHEVNTFYKVIQDCEQSKDVTQTFFIFTIKKTFIMCCYDSSIAHKLSLKVMCRSENGLK